MVSNYTNIGKRTSSENGSVILFKIILFVLWPFGAFLYSLKNLNSKSSYIVFFLFCILFGWCFTINFNSGFDSIRYTQDFNDYTSVTLSEYLDGLRGFIMFDNLNKDYYFDTIAFIVSRFTNNYHYLYATFAIIFSCIYLSSLKFLTSNKHFDRSIYCIIIALYFTLSNTIFNINGMRFWTAAWLAIFCTFQIYINHKNKYFFLSLLLPFIHSAFWIYLVMLMLSRYIMKYDKLWLILALLSIPLSYLSIDIIIYISDFLPSLFQKSIEFYTDQDYVATRNSLGTGLSSVERIFSILIVTYTNIIIIFFNSRKEQIKKDSGSYNLYRFLLILMTFSNFTMIIPSLGNRFSLLIPPIISIIWINNFKNKKYSIYIYAIPIIYSFQIIYILFRRFAYVLDSNFLYQNLITLIITNNANT